MMGVPPPTGVAVTSNGPTTPGGRKISVLAVVERVPTTDRAGVLRSGGGAQICKLPCSLFN